MFIKEIQLDCNSLHEARQFYCGTLGLECTRRDDEQICIRVGESNLVFRQTISSKPAYHFAFNIPHNQIGEALEWIKTRAEVIPADGEDVVDFKNWNAESIYFYDFNKNIVELIARRNLDNASSSKFTGHSLLSISEIGIIVDNIEEACQRFSDLYDLKPFIHQPVKENFAALGDDNGLLILSTAGRHWFPTAIEANQFPLSVQFENAGQLYYLEA